MNIVFYIGWQNVGMSLIQRWLIKNENRLNKKGILYPRTGRWDEGPHHDLALALHPVNGYETRGSTERIWNSLANEISQAREKSDIKMVFISSDLMPPIYEYPDVIQILEKLDTGLSIVAVVQDQLSLLKFIHQQSVIDPAIRMQCSIYELFTIRREHLLFYEKLIEYRQAYNWRNFVVLKNDPIALVEKLADIAGWPNYPSNIIHKEEPPPFAAIETIRRLNKLEMPVNTRRLINEQILTAFTEMSLESENLKEVSEQEYKSILEYYKISNQELFNQYHIKLE